MKKVDVHEEIMLPYRAACTKFVEHRLRIIPCTKIKYPSAKVHVVNPSHVHWLPRGPWYCLNCDKGGAGHVQAHRQPIASSDEPPPQEKVKDLLGTKPIYSGGTNGSANGCSGIYPTH